MDIQSFWGSRHTFYWDELHKIWSRILSVVGAGDATKAYNTLLGFYKQESSSSLLRCFTADWNFVKNFIEQNGASSDMSEAIYMISFDPSFKDHSGRLDYQQYTTKILEDKDPEQSKQLEIVTQVDHIKQLAWQFRKLIKYLQLFRTTCSVCETLIEFRCRYDVSGLNIEFLPRPESFSVALKGIAETLEGWRGISGNVTFSSEIKRVIPVLVKTPEETQNLSFHCELQLLDKFITKKRI
jgi:hypothetical protein